MLENLQHPVHAVLVGRGDDWSELVDGGESEVGRRVERAQEGLDNCARFRDVHHWLPVTSLRVRDWKRRGLGGGGGSIQLEHVCIHLRDLSQQALPVPRQHGQQSE